MITYEFLQQYWWVLISILGSALVFLLFVNGGGAQIFTLGKNESEKSMIINSCGRKWEFTFTTLVVFGGAFFASFPLFYSTSFGGAYWVWMLILLMFVLQAVSYEFQHRIENPKWVKTFRIFLVVNGWLAPFLIGAAVSTFFTGSDFTVNKNAMGSMAPIISTWGNNWHGLEALADWRNWAFGLMLVALSQTTSLLYLLNNIDDASFNAKTRKRLAITAPVFVVLFLVTAAEIFLSKGFAVDGNGVVFLEPYKYLHNLIQMPAVFVMLVAGVLLVLYGIGVALFSKSEKCWKKAVWPYGFGVVLTVLSLFFAVGFNGTAYYPSSTDIQSSLTLVNSCSSLFTLKTMAIVSLLIPFVLAYMIIAWRAIDRQSITRDELEKSEDKY